MPVDTDQDDLADWLTAAHHEAGHAVAAVVLGKNLRSVTIFGRRGGPWDWSGETVTSDDDTGTPHEVVQLLAGPMAEAQFAGSAGVEVPRDACRREIEEAKAKAARLRLDYNDLKGQSVDLVARYWSSVAALAACFEDDDEADAALATEVITAHFP
ncbi:MAG: M50 family metallopeptidase [Actinobacteria bacterium]|nr:M50 family metallopeptidase [Actinomycetota bacterium]